MNLDISQQSLPVYEALASKVRLKIISLLTKQPMNIRELAEALGLSSSIMTMHIKKLEKANLIRTEMVPGKSGLQKLCHLCMDEAFIHFPTAAEAAREYHHIEILVGQYSNFDVQPTCGLATPDNFIGEVDDPRYFLDPSRLKAKILWFSEGFVEYKAPNFLLPTQNPLELVISLEIASEAPLTDNHWPSDVSFYFNGQRLGVWTSPGDFGDRRGKYNPSWWPDRINQYGLLKHLSISQQGTFMDGIQLSSITLGDINIRNPEWTLRIAIEESAAHIGGVTLFGAGFGNYNQDIDLRMYYETQDDLDSGSEHSGRSINEKTKIPSV